MPNASKLFAVFRKYGPSYVTELPLESQAGWNDHAGFMDDLERNHLLIMGGPLLDVEGVLLVCRCTSAETLHVALESDPWSKAGILESGQISRWELRIGNDLSR